jgi:hypothetical protein
MFKFIKNKIIQFWNILKTIPFLLLFYIYINIGYKYYIKTNDDLIRIRYANNCMYYFFLGLSLGIGNNIIYLNELDVDLEKISIINSNHTHPNDIFIMFHLFNKNKIKGSSISSISTSRGINDLDKIILKMEEAAMVNNTSNDIKNINKKFNYWNNRSYNTALITFFEGIAIKDSKIRSKELKYLLDPKTLGFALCIKNNKSNYMYDLNIIYTHKNKILDPKSNNFTLLLFHPETKIYVELNKYELPKYEDAINWIKELYQLKDEQIDNIISQL